MERTRAIAIAAVVLCGSLAFVHARHLEEHPKFAWRLLEARELSAVITVNATTFTEQRQAVQVTWSGVAAPAADDMIALYVPADADVTATVPVEFLACSLVAPGYNTSGNGTHVFHLLNMRQSFRFALVKGALSRPTLIAQSPSIANLIPNQPTGLHLALHEDERSVVVQWVTAASAMQYVRVRPQGALANASRMVRATTAYTYAARQMCGYPANSTGWLDPGFTQSAVLLGSDLQPGQRYVYSVGSNETGWTKDYSFQAPVGPGWSNSSATPFQFLNFNDIAMSNAVMKASAAGVNFIDTYGENSTKLSSWLGAGAEANAHVALIAGDLSYAQGYGADWDVFGDQFLDVFTQWPLAVTNGNHERDFPFTGDAFNNTAADSGGECSVPFMYRWYSPANARMNPDVAYYDFAQGPVHFIMVDTEMPTAVGTPQHDFVSEALASVDRRITPWVVVALHRMMAAPSTWSAPYSGDIEVELRLQQDFEELFHTYQVDVVLQGHEHAYARSCPMYPVGSCFSSPANGTVGLYGGPVYILAGHAGARATNVFPHPLPTWVEYGVEAVSGYLRGTVTNQMLRIESIRSADGGLMDKVELWRAPVAGAAEDEGLGGGRALLEQGGAAKAGRGAMRRSRRRLAA